MITEPIAPSLESINLPQIAIPEYSDEQTYQMSLAAAIAADERKGTNILLLAIGEVSALAEYFVIATGLSKAQVRAIANSARDKIAEECDRLPLHSSGSEDTGWILLDYGDVIIHVMMPQEREFYNLEAFWGHVTKLVLPPTTSQEIAKNLTQSLLATNQLDG
jgi:ribosome-associated protein